ncbi:hypothetical protein ACET3X_008772 [Alternaria dauci]|uniref:Tachykinin family protein n=1 Tax=Alternaria dauci TaxID=48095 RepID=A0ABR3UCU3_9PLEO
MNRSRTFNFVNLTHPDDLKDESTQLRIRSLAMTEVGKARRKPRTKRERNEIILEFRRPAENRVETGRLGSGHTDPFSPYPIDLDDSARTLVANIFSPNTNHASQLLGSWYPVGLSSAASFHHVLANSHNFLFQKLHGFFPSADDYVALAHRQRAYRCTSEMIKDPTKHKSDEMIGAVAAMMSHLALLGSFGDGNWEKHRNAFARIIRLRGGYDAVDKEYLRITITWVDLIGCFAQDIPPIVPMPSKWKADSKSPPNSPRPSSAISLAWKQQLPMQLGWISIFDDITQLISLDQVFNVKQQVLASTSGSWMEPTLYRLLALRPLQSSNRREHVIEEICRLGTLLFLAPFWRILGQNPVWTAAISRNLLLVLMRNDVEWNQLIPLLIWALYLAAIETNDIAERGQLVFMLSVHMRDMHLQEWDDMMQIIEGVLWVENVFAGSDELICNEVMQIVNHKPLANTSVEAVPTLL